MRMQLPYTLVNIRWNTSTELLMYIVNYNRNIDQYILKTTNYYLLTFNKVVNLNNLTLYILQ